MTETRPQLWIVAGPNGVGKTTYAFRYIRAVSGSTSFVNLDEIARGLSPLDPSGEQRRSARVALDLTRSLIAEHRSFSLETTLSGRTLAAEEVDIVVRVMSMGQAHKATPITGAICLAIAARVPGGVPHAACRATPDAIRIGHPSGSTLVAASVTSDGEGALHAEFGAVYRTARRLFEGRVAYRA